MTALVCTEAALEEMMDGDWAAAEALWPLDIDWSREVLLLSADFTPAVLIAYPRRQEDVPHRVGRIGDSLLVW
jgi:hypothetical protein